jgi:hypothetical protein
VIRDAVPYLCGVAKFHGIDLLVAQEEIDATTLRRYHSVLMRFASKALANL